MQIQRKTKIIQIYKQKIFLNDSFNGENVFSLPSLIEEPFFKATFYVSSAIIDISNYKKNKLFTAFF